MPKYSYEKNDNTYLTPPSLIQMGLQLLAQEKNVFGKVKFDLDVCCSNKNIPADNYYMCGEKDGLKEPWMKYNWCNPPFDECKKWVQKAFAEQLKGNTSLLLIPARVETGYWFDYIHYKRDVIVTWLRKGYKFLDPKTKQEMGVFKNALAFVLFRGKRV